MTTNTKKSCISLCMIVKNEEKNLPGCLDSVKDLVDEIIIVDTGSTDQTKETVTGYDIRWFDFNWIDDFSAARNYSVEKAAGEWILVLDADERLPAGEADKIRALVSSGSGMAYNLNFRSTIRGSTAGKIFIHTHSRLFKNGLGFRFSGKVHEQIIDSVIDAGGSLQNTDIFVDHIGYSNESASMSKIERNIRILEKELAEKPDDGNIYFYLGESYSQLEHWQSAIDFYEKSAQKKNISPLIRALVLQNQGTAYVNAGFPGKGRDAERASLKALPGRITPHTVIAEAAMTERNYDLAVWEFELILDLLSRFEYGDFTQQAEIIPEKPSILYRLAEAYYLNKDFRRSIAYCRLVLKDDPKNENVLFLKARSHFSMDDFKAARSVLESILENNPDMPEALLLMGKITGNLGDYEAARTCFEKILESQPEHDEALNHLEKVTRFLQHDAQAYLSSETQPQDSAELIAEKHRVEELLRQNKIREAKHILDSLLQRFDYDSELYFLYAYAADAGTDSEKTIEYCNKALMRCDSDPRVYYLLGNAYMKQQIFEKAVVSYESAVKLQPDMFEAWSRLGVAAVKHRDYSTAKKAFDHAHKLNPEDNQIKRNLAVVCSKLGLQREAERYLLMTKG